MGSSSLKGWIEGIAAAIVALLLTFISLPIGEYTIALAVIPLVFISLRRGLVPGLFASALAGILAYLFTSTGDDVASNIVREFGPLAFVGISGFFAKFTQRTLHNKRFSNAALNITTASFFGAFIYFVWILIDSVLLNENSIISFLQVDGVSFLLTFATTAILLLVLAKTAPKMFVPKDTRFLSRKEKSRLLND